MKKVVLYVGLGSFMSLVAACGKGGSGDGNAAPVQRSELPSRAAKAICASLAGCCKNEGFPFDTAKCESQHTTELAVDFDSRSNGREYNAEAAGECLADMKKTLHCGVALEPPSCRVVFQGRSELGEPCNVSQDCADFAEGLATCNGFTCVAPPRHAQAGEVCDTTCIENNCISLNGGPYPGQEPLVCFASDGLYCEGQPSTTGEPAAPRCTVIPKLGEPCAGLCATGSYCDFSTRLCYAPKADGAICDFAEECESGVCEGSCGGTDVGAEECVLE